MENKVTNGPNNLPVIELNKVFNLIMGIDFLDDKREMGKATLTHAIKEGYSFSPDQLLGLTYHTISECIKILLENMKESKKDFKCAESAIIVSLFSRIKDEILRTEIAIHNLDTPIIIN